MTQAQLAEDSDIAVETLSRIERGSMSPSLELLERLSIGLGVPVSSIVADAGDASLPDLRPADRNMLSLLQQLEPDDASRLVRAVRTLVEIGATRARGRKRR